GDNPERQLLAAAANDDRRIRLLHRLRGIARLLQLVIPAIEVGQMLRAEALVDLTRLSKSPDALAGTIERDVHARVLVLIPARADAEIEPPARDNIHGAG